MERLNAYIDESGDPRFVEGASNRLEFTAIIIKADNEEEITAELESIKMEMGIKEFKSSKIKERNRIRILEGIKGLNFKILSLSIDKSKIVGKSREYPNSFYKYTQKLINKEITRLFSNIHVMIDKFGHENYQDSICRYLEKEIQYSLFDSSLSVDSAKTTTLIQLADFFSGTIRKLKQNEVENKSLIQRLIEEHTLYIKNWPEDYSRFAVDSIEKEHDKKIAEKCIGFAEDYIKKNNNKPLYKAKVIALELLLFNVKYINFQEYTYSAEIQNWLQQNGHTYTEEEFRRQVIAELRDEGVIIAGSSKGLKIPLSEAELVDYLNFTSSKYLTSIRRLKSTYESLKGASLDEISVFKSDEFEVHKRFFALLD
jgi:hypothetical protein